MIAVPDGCDINGNCTPDAGTQVLTWLFIVVGAGLVLLVLWTVVSQIRRPSRPIGDPFEDDPAHPDAGPHGIVRQYHMYAHQNPDDPFDHMRRG